MIKGVSFKKTISPSPPYNHGTRLNAFLSIFCEIFLLKFCYFTFKC